MPIPQSPSLKFGNIVGRAIALLLRKIALNLVASDRSSQISLRGRRKKAARNDDYMLRIVTRQAHA
jgi:hypothetical protein